MPNNPHITPPPNPRTLRRGGRATFALVVIGLMLVVALLADFLANDRPLWCQIDGKTYWPVFTPALVVELPFRDGSVRNQRFDVANWYQVDLESAVWPLIPFAGKRVDTRQEAGLPPFSKVVLGENHQTRHWLGTTNRGTDLLAGLIQGVRVSLLVGLLAVAITGAIGITLGLMAGYFGDEQLKITRWQLLAFLLAILPFWFYGFYLLRFELTQKAELGFWPFLGGLGMGLLRGMIAAGIIYALSWLAGRGKVLRKKITVPLDTAIMKLIELINSIPLLLLILTLAAISNRSLGMIILIIGLFSWTGVARLTRAEILRVRAMPYVAAARLSGISRWRLFTRHLLPNGLTPVWIALAFGIGNAIIAESALSFLNIAGGHLSWGSLLGASRSMEASQWWVALFPGLMIFLAVFSFNLMGERLRDWLDPRQVK